MNSVCLLGRLTRDPELRYTQGGTAMCSFTLAVDRNMSREKRQEAEASGQPTADFIRVVCWRQTAELVANYMTKGRQIAVEGRIQTGSYEKDGQRVYTTDVVADRVHFVGSAQDGAPRQGQGTPRMGGGFQGQGQGGFSRPENSFQGGNQQPRSNDSFYPIDNDEIPF